MAESAIVDRILAHAAKVPRLLLRKRHGDEFSVRGDPDLSGCYRGCHIEVEVKRPGERPDELQAHRLREWYAAGAHTTWVTSAEAFSRWLEEIPQTNVVVATLMMIALSPDADPVSRLRATDCLADLRQPLTCAACRQPIERCQLSLKGVHERCYASK